MALMIAGPLNISRRREKIILAELFHPYIGTESISCLTSSPNGAPWLSNLLESLHWFMPDVVYHHWLQVGQASTSWPHQGRPVIVDIRVEIRFDVQFKRCGRGFLPVHPYERWSSTPRTAIQPASSKTMKLSAEKVGFESHNFWITHTE